VVVLVVVVVDPAASRSTILKLSPRMFVQPSETATMAVHEKKLNERWIRWFAVTPAHRKQAAPYHLVRSDTTRPDAR